MELQEALVWLEFVASEVFPIYTIVVGCVMHTFCTDAIMQYCIAIVQCTLSVGNLYRGYYAILYSDCAMHTFSG